LSIYGTLELSNPSFKKMSLNLGMEKKSPVSNKALFILNPNAGVQPINFIFSKELDRRKNVSSVKSFSIDDTETLMDQNFNKFDVFIAAGGDGTVHTVATKLIGTDKILGVLPIGSGNGFAKEFGFWPIVKPLLDDIERGESVHIDIIEINDKLCLNVAGIGLDSFVAHSFDKLRLRGFFPYVGLTIKTFLQLRPVHITIFIDGEKIVSEKLFVLTIANTRQFGNNAFIAPQAVPNDGIVDIVLIKPFPKIFGLIFIIRLFTKRINNSKYVRHIKTDKEVIIKTDENRFHIDGEPVKISGEVVVRIKREALKVLRTKHNKM
jgi:YegS/Rv2252/BmrU family lipid kinase